jgi:capsular polysaccharide export protein
VTAMLRERDFTETQGLSALAPPGFRVFLFLQGLPGPFFSRLAGALAARGAGIHRINFNGGDESDWTHPAIAFCGDLTGWEDFLGATLTRLGITDVVLFNDARPLHAIARSLCQARAVPVHVFEDGYLRPHYITLEQGGVNRNSPLPRRLAEIEALATNLAASPPPVPVPASFRRRASDGVRYELFAAARRRRYPYYRSHRPLPALAEARGWLLRLWRMSGEKRRSARALAAIAGRRFFILPLQLDADTQLRLYSGYGGMRPALTEVIASFARHAPADSVLVIKQHPLDSALTDWRGLSHYLATSHGIGDRLIYLEGGDINTMLPGCAGLVTINSTTGMSALENNVPVLVLGSAVYGIDGIVAPGPLDAFWSAPGSVDRTAYQALRKVMMRHSLLPGGFHSDAGIALAVRNAAARLMGPVA